MFRQRRQLAVPHWCLVALRAVVKSPPYFVIQVSNALEPGGGLVFVSRLSGRSVNRCPQSPLSPAVNHAQGMSTLRCCYACELHSHPRSWCLLSFLRRRIQIPECRVSWWPCSINGPTLRFFRQSCVCCSNVVLDSSPHAEAVAYPSEQPACRSCSLSVPGDPSSLDVLGVLYSGVLNDALV